MRRRSDAHGQHFMCRLSCRSNDHAEDGMESCVKFTQTPANAPAHHRVEPPYACVRTHKCDDLPIPAMMNRDESYRYKPPFPATGLRMVTMSTTHWTKLRTAYELIWPLSKTPSSPKRSARANGMPYSHPRRRAPCQRAVRLGFATDKTAYMPRRSQDTKYNSDQVAKSPTPHWALTITKSWAGAV